MDDKQNPELIEVGGKAVRLQDYVQEHERLNEENRGFRSEAKKAVFTRGDSATV